MANAYVVLGAGRQGMAIAYDLARLGESEAIHLCDVDARRVRFAANYINQLLGSELVRGEVLDVTDREAVLSIFRDVDACISAISYNHNFELSKLALESHTHFCDLGGNTGVVRSQIELHNPARATGISIVPDCGLAPGLANSLAKYALEQIESSGNKPTSVSIYCGGLPQEPRPPLNYAAFFSMEGLINEYDYPTHVLRDGRVMELEPLEELEELEPFPMQNYSGPLEAFLTSGGSSLSPWLYEGRLNSYDYKTVRYPGHCAQIKLLRDLGLFEEGERRRIMIEALNERLPRDDRKDLVLLRVIATGENKSQDLTRVQFQLIDYYDGPTGFTAMERTTGFSASIVAQMQANGQIEPGANTPDPAVPAKLFIEQLRQRGFQIDESTS